MLLLHADATFTRLEDKVRNKKSAECVVKVLDSLIIKQIKKPGLCSVLL